MVPRIDAPCIFTRSFLCIKEGHKIYSLMGFNKVLIRKVFFSNNDLNPLLYKAMTWLKLSFLL